MSVRYNDGIIHGLSGDEVDVLKDLDLGYNLSRVYITLLRSDIVMTAGDAAGIEGINNDRMYCYLRQLYDMGIVDRKGHRPSFYSAFSPESPEVQRAIDARMSNTTKSNSRSRIVSLFAMTNDLPDGCGMFEASDGSDIADDCYTKHNLMLSLISDAVGESYSETVRINPNNDLIRPICDNHLDIDSRMVFAKLRELGMKGVMRKDDRTGGRSDRYITTKEKWNDYMLSMSVFPQGD